MIMGERVLHQKTEQTGAKFALTFVKIESLTSVFSETKHMDFWWCVNFNLDRDIQEAGNVAKWESQTSLGGFTMNSLVNVLPCVDVPSITGTYHRYSSDRPHLF